MPAIWSISRSRARRSRSRSRAMRARQSRSSSSRAPAALLPARRSRSLGRLAGPRARGAIIKGGRYLEALWRVDTVAFDKTGTVTIGRPEIVEIRPAAGVTERAVLEAAAIAERRSEHPLATAIVRAADAGRLPPVEPQAFEYTPGRGIVAHLNGEDIIVGNRRFVADHGVAPDSFSADIPEAASEVSVVRAGKRLGTILIADRVRPEAFAAIEALRRLGIRTVLLSGDTFAVAHAVADALRIDEIQAELLPHQKVTQVRRLAEHRPRGRDGR